MRSCALREKRRARRSVVRAARCSVGYRYTQRGSSRTVGKGTWRGASETAPFVSFRVSFCNVRKTRHSHSQSQIRGMAAAQKST
eukprot:5268572-Prymnesium_polylepis.1